MAIRHSVNKEQVNRVLMQFEATMTAIHEIENKVSRVHGYIETVRHQKETLELKAREAAGIVDNLSKDLERRSDEVLEYFSTTLETFASVVEELESSIADFDFQDLPREIQREFGPLLVPAFVLVLIVTASNCYFGFLLADDAELTETLFSALSGSSQMATVPGGGPPVASLNILRVFAIFHVSLIGLAVAYLILEACKGQKAPPSCLHSVPRESSLDDVSSESSSPRSRGALQRGNAPNSFAAKPVSRILRRMHDVASSSHARLNRDDGGSPQDEEDTDAVQGPGPSASAEGSAAARAAAEAEDSDEVPGGFDQQTVVI